MPESRAHRQLVARLLQYMLARGIIIRGADAPGWPMPPLVGGRRPDVFGYYTVSGSAVAGEAKRGPELWASRDQIQDVAMALPYYGPTGGGALLILAVSMGWEADAGELCRTIHASRTATAIWSPES